MIAAATHARPGRGPVGWLAGNILPLLATAMAAAIAAGVALSTRDPGTHFDLSLLPVMAEQPIALADGRRLWVQKYEVTVTEWNACHDDGGCAMRLRAASGRPEATTPATGLNFLDVSQYVAWISGRTGHPFRLPGADEWSQMAAPVLPPQPAPLFRDPVLSWASAYLVDRTPPRMLRPQGSFSTTPQGIADLDGSVWEWTGDCEAGEAVGTDASHCPAYVVAGEHRAVIPYLVGDPARGGCAVGAPPAHLGLRLVSDREPPLRETR